MGDMAVNVLIGKILCNNGFRIDSDTFAFVIDREICQIVNKNKTKPPGIQLKENDAANKQASSIIWDKNFPRPYFYLVECKKSSLDKKVVLECLSNAEEVLCVFTVVYVNGLIFSDFRDSDNNIFNVQKQDEKAYDFILNCKKQNIESIKNSSDYLNRVEMLRPVCLNALKVFCNFTDQIRLICNLVRSVGINKFNLSEAWQSEKRMIQLTCFIAKSLALLSIPSQNKTKHARTISFFSKRIDQILRMVQKVIASLVVDIHIQEELEKLENDTVEYIEANLTDCSTQLLDEQSFDKLGMFYLKISEHIEPLEIAVQDIVENHNYNTDVIKDLNIKAVDMFVEKYYSLLFDYCLIVINYDEFYLVDYFHELCNRQDPLFETKLVQLFIDKYVCKNLLKHLINYSSDRTDFLIFFHTQYFQNEFASRILKNLRFLYDTQLYNVTMNNLMIGDSIKEMQVHLKEISNLFKKWNTVLNQPHLVKMTFEELLKYENTVSSTSDNVECDDSLTYEPIILKPKNNNLNAQLIFLACFLIVIIGCYIYFKFVKQS